MLFYFGKKHDNNCYQSIFNHAAKILPIRSGRVHSSRTPCTRQMPGQDVLWYREISLDSEHSNCPKPTPGRPCISVSRVTQSVLQGLFGSRRSRALHFFRRRFRLHHQPRKNRHVSRPTGKQDDLHHLPEFRYTLVLSARHPNQRVYIRRSASRRGREIPNTHFR